MFKIIIEKKQLATFVFFILTSITYLISEINLDSVSIWGTKNSIIAISFLYPPIFYFLFYEKLIGPIPFNYQTFFHFIPVLLFTFIINVLGWDNFDQDIHLESYYFINENLNYLSTLYLFKEIQLNAYLILDLNLIFSIPVFSNLLDKSSKEGKFLILIYIALFIRIILNKLFFKTFFFIDIHFNLLFLLLLFLFIFCVIKIISIFISYFDQFEPSIEVNKIQLITLSKDLVLKENSLVQNSTVELTLSSEMIQEIDLKFQIYLESKPTRDLKFNKVNVLQELDIPEYVINAYFNKYLKMSFKNWKTIIRINDSTDLIEKGFLVHHTVDALAREVGFLSRGRFVQAFQKINNCPPSQYLRQNSYKIDNISQ